jgi:hypothetical protein
VAAGAGSGRVLEPADGTPPPDTPPPREGDFEPGPEPVRPPGDGTPAAVDLGASAVLVLVALYVLYEARQYPGSIVEGSPGPALFPRVLAVALLLLCGIMVHGALRRRAPETRAVDWAGVQRAALVVLLLATFLIVAEYVDFFVLMFALLAAVGAVAGEKRLHVIVLVPLLFVVFLYVVFFRGFGVMFPTQIF